MWWTREYPLQGLVAFPGTLLPRVDEMRFLEKDGIDVRPQTAQPGELWRCLLRHREWGEAELSAPQDSSAPQDTLLEYVPLAEQEREEARRARCALGLQVKNGSRHLLRDRKRMLRYLRAVLGSDGVYALDQAAQKMWTRAALDDELSHDADLDVEALYTLHCVYDAESGTTGDEKNVHWMHSHGLAEIGGFDFDLLKPSPAVWGLSGQDSLRALAYAVLEGQARIDDAEFPLAYPNGSVALVDVQRFHQEAAEEHTALRDLDEFHSRQRVVLCDPLKKPGILGRLFGAKPRPQPSQFLSGPLPEQVITPFSRTATELMAERAQKTFGVFKQLKEEFAEFPLTYTVKLGYTVDNGAPDDREHLWFEVHAAGDSTLDATLANQPFNIARMKEGQRGTHDAGLITDWVIFTPLGPITPRFSVPARRIRENREKMRAFFRELSAR